MENNALTPKPVTDVEHKVQFNVNTNVGEKIRFDRYLATNASNFKQFGNDGQLMLSIVIYIALTYQSKDLFGYGSFDVTDFANKMNYDKGNLFRKHPDPAFFKKDGMEFKKFYTTNIGNAFFRLFTEKMVLSSKRKNVGNVESFTDSSISMLTSLDVSYESLKNKTKVIYQGEEGFIASLNKAFTLININYLPNLRKPKLDALYIYLCQLKDVLVLNKEVVANPSFDFLCSICDINSKDVSQAKKYLTKKLKRLNDDSDLKFDVQFYQKAGRYNYGVRLIFQEMTFKNYETEHKEAVVDVLDNLYMRNLLLTYKSSIISENEELDKVKFFDWAENKRANKDLKKKIYVSVYNSIFPTKISVYDVIVKNKFDK